MSWLVGGTGVGKSSLLNALAGATVSTASVRRPTTSEPVAWVPAADRDGLAPLLAWLGVDDVREHEADGLRSVAILDLPDMDLVQTHRERVEARAPKVDAVAWVTDLENITTPFCTTLSFERGPAAGPSGRDRQQGRSAG